MLTYRSLFRNVKNTQNNHKVLEHHRVQFIPADIEPDQYQQ